MQFIGLRAGWPQRLILLPAALALLYAFAPAYEYPPPAPFRGTLWHSPYPAGPLVWQAGNFHAHAKSWLGATAGDDTPEAMLDAYAALGIRAAVISDYEHITRAPRGHLDLPTYEHGWNVRKTHQLVIGASHVRWFDIPLWQDRDSKQAMLDALHEDGALVAIVHPYLRDGYNAEDMLRLTGYDLLEIRSHYGDATAHWDRALSSGHLVYALGNDDSHRIAGEGQFGATWTMLNIAGVSPAAVVAALRDGRSYVVKGHRGRSDVRLESLRVIADTVSVVWTAPVLETRFIGDDGATLSRVAQTSTASFVIPVTQSYLRVEASTATDTVYLNPVIRWNGRSIPSTRARADSQLTLIRRLSSVLAIILLGSFAFYRKAQVR